MNELSFGPLPEARAAATEAIARANRYPARDADPLRAVISAANPGITTANVVVGNGSSEVLVDLLQILERPGEVIFPWPSFPFYSSATRVVGLTECRVGLDGRHSADLDALHAAVGPETRAVSCVTQTTRPARTSPWIGCGPSRPRSPIGCS
jgi:histidinol-phosphate aminotransferase